ncbi:MAG: hypothetical protein MUC36_08820 [Planctomycetes bacterium]|jgi:hypothetical protein|nr:hypothetical protein [Planctomycetota bacterium]
MNERRAGSRAPDPHLLHGQVATSAALAAPRPLLPSTRRHRAAEGAASRSFAKALAIALLLFGAAWWLPMAASVPVYLVSMLWLVLLPTLALAIADRHRPTDRRVLALGGLFGAAAIGALLAVRHPGYLALSSPLWIGSALWFYRGLGRGSGGVLLWLLGVMTLAAALLWVSVLLSLQSIPVQTGPHAHWGPIEVFAGWPFAGYVGSVRGGMAKPAPWLADVLWRNYLVLLGVAALVLSLPRLRTPTVLATWLPRLCSGLAIVQFAGGLRLALAVDG